ncbi:MAG: glutaredoxin family protein [Candidatus Marinimicrobia bacterium]|nr:glutaredoxin family protein [Candidatus Neomarinimicrobiota bacterium]
MIKIYSTSWCPSCNAAKQLLASKGMEYEEINIEEINMSREQLAELTGGMSVPQIVINDTNIGGFDKLMMMNQSGELETLLNA